MPATINYGIYTSRRKNRLAKPGDSSEIDQQVRHFLGTQHGKGRAEHFVYSRDEQSGSG